MKNIPIAEIKLTKEEVAVAVNVLESGALRQGKECNAFEQEFAAKAGARFAVKILWMMAKQQITYATTDQVSGISGFMQSIQHL